MTKDLKYFFSTHTEDCNSLIVDSFLRKKEEGILQLKSCQNDEKLPYFSDSSDKFIVELINDDPSMKDEIRLFNSTEKSNIAESSIGKQIIGKIFHSIQRDEFRNTEIGKSVYNEFRMLHRNITLGELETNKGFVFDETIIKNSFYYLMLACAGTDPVEISFNLLKFFSSSYSPLSIYTNIDSNVEQIVEEMNLISKEGEEKILKMETRKSNYIKLLGTGAYKLVKMSLVSNPMILSTCHLAFYSYIGYKAGNCFSESNIENVTSVNKAFSNLCIAILVKTESDTENGILKKASLKLLITILRCCGKNL